MKSIAIVSCWFLMLLSLTSAARATTMIYVFAGTSNSGGPFAQEAFQITVPDFINPQLNSPGTSYSCTVFDSITDCSGIGVIFSNQSVLGVFSAQLEFFSPASGDSYFFPTGAFRTPGVYTSQQGPNLNIGTLAVAEAPESSSIMLTLFAGLMFLAGALAIRKSRRPLRRPQSGLPSN